MSYKSSFSYESNFIESRVELSRPNGKRVVYIYLYLSTWHRNLLYVMGNVPTGWNECTKASHGENMLEGFYLMFSNCSRVCLTRTLLVFFYFSFFFFYVLKHMAFFWNVLPKEKVRVNYKWTMQSYFPLFLSSLPHLTYLSRLLTHSHTHTTHTHTQTHAFWRLTFHFCVFIYRDNCHSQQSGFVKSYTWIWDHKLRANEREMAWNCVPVTCT